MGKARPPAYGTTYLNTPPTGTTDPQEQPSTPARRRARHGRHAKRSPPVVEPNDHIRNPRSSTLENSNPRLAPHATNEPQPRKNVTSRSMNDRSRRASSRRRSEFCFDPADSKSGSATTRPGSATNGKRRTCEIHLDCATAVRRPGWVRGCVDAAPEDERIAGGRSREAGSFRAVALDDPRQSPRPAFGDSYRASCTRRR